MKSIKSTLESFKENELLRTHKLKINGGLTSEGTPPLELPLEEFEDENGDPASGTGPRGTGGSSSGAAVATLGNTGLGNLPLGGGK